MRTSPYYLPVEDWRALWDIVLAVLDPHLAPFWLAAVARALGAGDPAKPPDSGVWVCAALAVLNVALYWLLIPYRTQQRFMLQAVGLAVVPLARLLDRGRWLRVAGLGLLVMHLLMSQDWPFAAGTAPWDLSRPDPRRDERVFFMPDLSLIESGPAAIRAADRPGRSAWAWPLGVAWAWSRVTGSGLRSLGAVRAALASLALFGVRVRRILPLRPRSAGAFYPAFRDYYLRLARPRDPGGGLRGEDRLRGDEHPLLLDGRGTAQRGPLRERRWSRARG